jgi:hypothetical protein
MNSVILEIGASTEIITGEGFFVTAGGVDAHIHFISSQQADYAILGQRPVAPSLCGSNTGLGCHRIVLGVEHFSGSGANLPGSPARRERGEVA